MLIKILIKENRGLAQNLFLVKLKVGIRRKIQKNNLINSTFRKIIWRQENIEVLFIIWDIYNYKLILNYIIQ